ncbi:MAG: hypothetical protein AAF250_03885 [Pseudomonadota bacterium]
MNSDQLIALFDNENDKNTLEPDLSKLGATIAILGMAVLFYFAWHFHEKAGAFEADAVAAHGVITSSEIGDCSIFEGCFSPVETWNYRLDLTYEFQTSSGKSTQASTIEPISSPSMMDYRVVGYTEEIHYLKSDPQRIVIGDPEIQIRAWRAYSVYLFGVGIVLAILFYFKGPYSPFRYD